MDDAHEGLVGLVQRKTLLLGQELEGRGIARELAGGDGKVGVARLERTGLGARRRVPGRPRRRAGLSGKEVERVAAGRHLDGRGAAE